MITYGAKTPGAGKSAYYNLIRDRSIVDSKNYEHTDRNGHVKGLLVNFQISTAASANLNLITAPNTWRMRNSFRKFHAYRELMFENAGVTREERGRYGHTLRPYMSPCHFAEEKLYDDNPENGEIGVVALYDCNASASARGGEWTYSRLATTPLYVGDNVIMGDSTLPVADEWPTTICGANVATDVEGKTSGTYASVGMIHSYNLDRQDVSTPTLGGEVITGPANPLAALIASGNQAAGEILELTTELELERPPYDIIDDGDSVKAQLQKLIKVASTGGIVNGSMYVPAGILQINSPASTAFTLHVEIVGEVLCKDMA